jgi:cobalt/nickel transport system permease protein
MYEELLEDIAQANTLREVSPYCKLLAGIGAIAICLASGGFIGPLLIALLLGSAILLLARIDIRTYAGLFLVPITFAGMSVAVIILLSGGQDIFWSWNPLPWLSFTVTRESINEGFFVFFRVLGGMSALFFIALTTPMTDLFVVMRRCRVPVVVLDLAMIIYRTIFIIMDQVKQVFKAQVMRLGYSTPRESVHSCAMLCGSAFIASWEAGEDLIRAMDARCFAGQFAMLGEVRPVELRQLVTVLAFLGISLVIVVVTRNIRIM